MCSVSIHTTCQKWTDSILVIQQVNFRESVVKILVFINLLHRGPTNPVQQLSTQKPVSMGSVRRFPVHSCQEMTDLVQFVCINS